MRRGKQGCHFTVSVRSRSRCLSVVSRSGMTGSPQTKTAAPVRAAAIVRRWEIQRVTANPQLLAARTASGSDALLPVCVSIHTTTTLPSEYSTLASFWSRMR